MDLIEYNGLLRVKNDCNVIQIHSVSSVRNPLTFKLTILVIELPWSGPTFRPLLLGQGPGEFPGTCH